MGKRDRTYEPPSDNESEALINAFEERYRQGKTDAARTNALQSAYTVAKRNNFPIPEWVTAGIETIIKQGFAVKRQRGERSQQTKATIEKRNFLCMLWLHQLKTSLKMTAGDAAIIVEEAFRHFSSESPSSMPHMGSVQLAQMYSRDKWVEELRGVGNRLPTELLAFAPESLKQKYPIMGRLLESSK